MLRAINREGNRRHALRLNAKAQAGIATFLMVSYF
jgi:hypothetical protein